MPGGTLFPDTMKQYDDYTIREALHTVLPIKTTLFNSVSISWRIQDICIIPMLAHSFLELWRMF